MKFCLHFQILLFKPNLDDSSILNESQGMPPSFWLKFFILAFKNLFINQN